MDWQYYNVAMAMGTRQSEQRVRGDFAHVHQKLRKLNGGERRIRTPDSNSRDPFCIRWRTSSTSTQSLGLKVQVAVDGSTANVVPEKDSDGVIYDQRWIQISSSVISTLDGCTSLNGAACS
jgi:hypothetical protein